MKDVIKQIDNKNSEFDFFNYVSAIRANDGFTDDPDDAITGDLRFTRMASIKKPSETLATP
ncbi:hypothetical protein [Cysteiniphilum sp. G11B1]|uniref:hypothetical protein n=1 Tax=Cysteiniphilum sp. G11B1 TaxID=3453126 RepID=UPI003F87C3D3